MSLIRPSAVACFIFCPLLAFASQSYETSLRPPEDRITCDLDRSTGRVRMLLDLSGHVVTSPILKTTVLVADLGFEVWARPDRLQKLCRSQREELLSRKSITGQVWVERKRECVCDASDCAIVESHSVSFTPLKADGYQHYYFSVLGRDQYEDPHCSYEEPNQ